MGKVLSRPAAAPRAKTKALKPGRFQHALEAMEALPLEDRAMVNDILKKRDLDERRAELVRAVARANEEFERGETRGGTIEDVLRMLNEDD